MTTLNDDAVDALYRFLFTRDWPSALPREMPARRYTYKCMAAAILNGEAWAIRQAWPEAASELVGMRAP
jgi:hypothetical protein